MIPDEPCCDDAPGCTCCQSDDPCWICADFHLVDLVDWTPPWRTLQPNPKYL